ncbi:hypothetical protein IMSAGC008_02034 [Muribaculaceae bacterium]|nr:hypothetical protein IMSAGC008_02034 [Muribaculaceae bacterium]
MFSTPSTPSIRNHASIKGPKQRPMASVPNRWTTNIIVIVTRVIATTGAEGLTALSPSIADVTVTAGVMIPSAISALAPIAATT